MFCIIDIETCGGTFEFRKGRIIEICILVHDGLQVVDKFSTLINPDCHISTMYTNISGITNDMVANAPKFHEVAKQIIDITENKIFIAHNVGFDYGFIQAEFKALGYKYKRDTLCTVRLSRKLIPGKASYSLGNLCQSLGIEIEGRHRAEGDAVATAKLFDMLLYAKSLHPQYKNQGVDELMTRRIDKMKQYILDKIPEECGVYYFLNKQQEIIYIGKSVNMYNRAVSHFNTKENKGKRMLNDLYNVDHIHTGSELIALLHEAEEIKKHKPHYNHMRKSESFTHCIDWFTDDFGIINFKLVEYAESENAILSFVSYSAARTRLEEWIDECNLCLRYCGLTADDSICFNHQIKKCNGICNQEEEVELYNKRVNEIINKFSFRNNNFVIVDKGRTNDERSIILIENKHYAGYGYFNIADQINSFEEFKGIIKRSPYYPDCDDLVRGWLNKNKAKIVV
jgi:DNA polymerase-3 subunit epsilon